jgi:hypothetical protein
MDHSVSSLAVDRPWRTATLVASAIAALELIALIAVGVILLGRSVEDQVRSAATEKAHAPAKPARAEAKPAAHRPAAKPPGLARSQTSVLVLNANGVSGAAAATAARLRGRGYLIGGVGNAPDGDSSATVIMYRRGFAGEAQRLARDLGIRVVAPLDGMRPREMLGAHVALVLGERK